MIESSLIPPLEPSFLPAARWNRRFRATVERDAHSRSFALALIRPDGTVFRHETRVLSAEHPQARLNFIYAERLLKFLLWQRGGSCVLVTGADELARHLATQYSPQGVRAFDAEFMGQKVYGEQMKIGAVTASELPQARETGVALGRHLDGCRIGFDLGGSDRKVAALFDGRVVFSEEIRWDPYFQTDPAYHLEGIQDSLRRAAAHLPRVDAIGGSAAGIYVNNEVRVASLFRGVPPDRFAADVRRIFFTLRERWGNVPLEVVNDGEVTALAGAMSLEAGGVLGVSMGTSQAGGYVRPSGEITTWLNELAFAPVDYSELAPRDEWSGDIGCGVQYFSQQGVVRLARRAGFSFPADMADPEKLVAVQEAMTMEDPRARAIYITIGRCFGHALAHYADFYDLHHVLVLGRVTSGEGGILILNEARNAIGVEYPDLKDRFSLSLPDEENRRHGQAVAAASLPTLFPQSR